MEISFNGTNEATSARDGALETKSPSAYKIKSLNKRSIYESNSISNKYIHTQPHGYKHAYIHTYNVRLVIRKP